MDNRGGLQHSALVGEGEFVVSCCDSGKLRGKQAPKNKDLS